MSSANIHSPLCHAPNLAPSPYPLSYGGLTVHHIFIIISAISVFLVWLMATGQTVDHWLHATKIHEQRYLARIINLPHVFGLFYLFPTIWYGPAAYIEQIPFIWEAICVCSLFELFCCTVAGPDRQQQEIFFQNLERQNRRLKNKHDRGSLRWFKTIHLVIYSFPVAVTVDTIVEIIAAATICPTSKVAIALKYCCQIVTIVATTSTIGAFVRFYRRLRPQLKAAHMLPKFLALKLLVGLIVHERFVFGIVVSQNVFHPTETFSLGDFSVGLLAVIICGQMLFFSVAYLFAFSAKPYRQLRRHERADGGLLEMNSQSSDPDLAKNNADRVRKGSIVAAAIATINLSDVFQGIWISFQELWELSGKMKIYTVDSRQHGGKDGKGYGQNDRNGNSHEQWVQPPYQDSAQGYTSEHQGGYQVPGA